MPTQPAERKSGLLAWFNRKVVTPTKDFVGGLVDAAREAVQDRSRYVKAMTEIGWIPTKLFDTETERLVLAVLGTQSATKAKADIEAALLHHFDAKRLESMAETWSNVPHMKHRLPIIREVLAGHTAKLYALTTPVVLAQIDGLLADTFGLKHGSSNVPWKRLRSLLKKAKAGAHLVVERFVDERVMVDFTRGAPLPSDVSRHAILHGVDLAYPTPQASLKSILLLDYVVWTIESLRFIHNGNYHRSGCQLLRQPYDMLPVIRNPFDLIRGVEGGPASPCTLCKADLFGPDAKPMVP